MMRSRETGCIRDAAGQILAALIKGWGGGDEEQRRRESCAAFRLPE